MEGLFSPLVESIFWFNCLVCQLKILLSIKVSRFYDIFDHEKETNDGFSLEGIMLFKETWLFYWKYLDSCKLLQWLSRVMLKDQGAWLFNFLSIRSKTKAKYPMQYWSFSAPCILFQHCNMMMSFYFHEVSLPWESMQAPCLVG